MIIDSHCHLNYEPMITNLDEVMARAKEKNVSKLLTISTDEKSFQNNLEIIKKYENVYGTFGIHPHEAKLFQSITAKKILENLIKNGIFVRMPYSFPQNRCIRVTVGLDEDINLFAKYFEYLNERLGFKHSNLFIILYT